MRAMAARTSVTRFFRAAPNFAMASASMATAPATGGTTAPLAAYALAKSVLQQKMFKGQQVAAAVARGLTGTDLTALGLNPGGILESLTAIDGRVKSWSGKLACLKVGHYKMAGDLGKRWMLSRPPTRISATICTLTSATH